MDYKWQWLDPKGKAKQKYELCFLPEELFAFAGLYSHWVDKAIHFWLKSTIIKKECR